MACGMKHLAPPPLSDVATWQRAHSGTKIEDRAQPAEQPQFWNTGPDTRIPRCTSCVGLATPLPAGLRQNQVRTVAACLLGWVIGGLQNGPGTHSADSDPALLTCDGLLRAQDF